MGEITGYKVANIAAHALLNTSFLYYKIEEHMKNGDIVVLPLELRYYSTDKIENWFSNNMMAWGHDDYLGNLSPGELFKFIVSVPESRVYEGVFQRQRKRNYVSREVAIEQFNALLASGVSKYRGYNFKSLDQYGSILVDERPKEKTLKLYKDGTDYIKNDGEINETFVSFYFRLKDLVAAREGKLILTWPVTIRNRLFDLTKSEHQKRLMDLKANLLNHSIHICFNPGLFNLDVKFFFDTRSHTNRYGSAIRSKNLADSLNKFLKYNACDDMGFDEAIKIVKKEEIKYSVMIESAQKTEKKTEKNNDKKRYQENTKIVIEDLKKIKKALSEYYKDNKKYPISVRFDGLYTNHGKAGINWIPGLVPKYIKSLPRDPRRTGDGSKQYLYKSNGKDYKLISHAAVNGKSVVKFNPELLDPKRKYWAYGYWTKGAKSW